ncbi:hypothetical protein Kisp01_35800 [Kineosporia sp. NBRC 101677]|nr:hypothetical protein Kisp01_35800 [Kineosporia sp. NBRC 101677]
MPATMAGEGRPAARSASRSAAPGRFAESGLPEPEDVLVAPTASTVSTAAVAAGSVVTEASGRLVIRTARCSWAVRVVASDQATEAGSRATAVARCSLSRAAWPASAASDRAESNQAAGAGAPANKPGPPTFSIWLGVALWVGASSRIAWALVPLIPNDDTPARRGRPVCGQSCGWVSRFSPEAAQSTCGVGSLMFSEAGSIPWRSAITVLITPATPAAAWVWPMFDFTEPTCTGRSAGRAAP